MGVDRYWEARDGRREDERLVTQRDEARAEVVSLREERARLIAGLDTIEDELGGWRGWPVTIDGCAASHGTLEALARVRALLGEASRAL